MAWFVLMSISMNTNKTKNKDTATVVADLLQLDRSLDPKESEYVRLLAIAAEEFLKHTLKQPESPPLTTDQAGHYDMDGVSLAEPAGLEVVVASDVKH